jgi:Domain of unknown function (DUF4333)
MRMLPAVLALLALAGCGGGDSSQDQGQSDRRAVGSAARGYIVAEQSDEDDPEEAASLSFTKVEVQGDTAKVEAKSSSTGNRYEVDLSKSGNSWRGTAVLTDRPSEPTQSGDPGQGSGQRASTDQVETQIEQRLLKLVRIKGQAECPPEIKIRRGNDFTCKVVGSSRPVTVQVTQKDDQGNLGFKLSTGR